MTSRAAGSLTAPVTFAGSLGVLDAPGVVEVSAASRVRVLATAAAFRGPADAIEDVLALSTWGDAEVRGTPALDRRSASDDAVLAEVSDADLVVLVDGAVLHARSVWRGSPLGEVLASKSLVALGAIGSVLGTTMIDPRGGAPTTGLGLFDGVVLTVPAGAEQLARTRSLLGADQILVELGARAVVTYDGTWRVVVGEDLVVTRAGVATDL